MYEQIALTLHDCKAILRLQEDDSASISVKEADLSAEKTEKLPNAEFDELARLFGVRKGKFSREGESRRTYSVTPKRKKHAKSDNGEEDISFSDVKLFSSKQSSPDSQNSSNRGAVTG